MLHSAAAAQASPSSKPFHLVADRLSDRLALRLISQIESGAWQPGDRLPTEQQLAESHGVSRTVVREAVHQLKSKALVISRQGSGVYVAQTPVNRPLVFDPAVLESVQAVVHVVEVRRVLEGEIAALAAERATRAQIAALRRALKAIDTAVAAGHDGVAEDLAFHRVIGESTGNPQFRLLLGFLEQYLREGMRITRGNEARRIDFMQAVQHEHRALVEAIANRDATAARHYATQHIIRGEERLVEGGVITGQRRRAAARVSTRQTPARQIKTRRTIQKETP
ncbi:FadR/GntR family transcriptional regulator [Variovorax sp. PAMC28562]|uniref:FadR/GntR family transcriptional regulator n=1 Tax=Variovorax sp. PAMC28562 TaxID=2762323 RepID=UPI0021C4724B|nr:FadR/GntR family transcriptional regulator [Variovorax sp. PAMC28562]